MAKTGCPVCLKPYGAGHWTVADCPQVKSEVKVERIQQPELPAPVKVQPRTLTRTLTRADRTLTVGDRTLTLKVRRQQSWEERQHPDDPGKWRRDYQREYMRKRRAE